MDTEGKSPLSPSVLPWISAASLPQVTSILQRNLRKHEEARSASICWRPDLVTDFRQRTVPVDVQRLMRWDNRGPDEIFIHGFRPLSQGQWLPLEMDLWTHVHNRVPSIFVSATVSYSNNRRGREYWLTPKDKSNMFAYEIMAPGGIDVNSSLGSHRHESQHEIAFPGGIGPQHIRTAREYDVSGRVVTIWVNGGFVAGSLFSLYPDFVCRFHVQQRIWTGDPESSYTVPESPELLNLLGYRDFMEIDGGLEVDPYACMSPYKPPRAAFVTHGTTDEVYFFASTEYARIKVVPGTKNHELQYGPRTIQQMWPSLKKAKFGMVDAALPSFKNNGETHFFSGVMYALIMTIPYKTTDYIVKGPLKITDAWQSLRQLGFTKVDAVLFHPSQREAAFFFNGENYALIDIHDDRIFLGPKKIVEGWPSLHEVGFSTIDFAFPNPKDKGEAYFFSGDMYVLIKVSPGTTDYIINGARRVDVNWPPLNKIGFY